MMDLLGPSLVVPLFGRVRESLRDRDVEGWEESAAEDEKQGKRGPMVGMQVKMI